MRKRPILLLCGAILLCILSLMTAVMVERNLTAKEQQIQATATVYVPSTQSTATQPGDTETTEPTAQMGPDFVVTDAMGKTYGILNFRGKPLVLCFWAASNNNAVRELEVFQELYDLYGDQIHFLMIHQTTQESKETAQALMDLKQYTFPVYFDTLGSAAKAYSVDTLPTSYFLSKEGELKARSKGNMDTSYIPKVLNAIGVTP